jgi:hypothetical protein
MAIQPTPPGAPVFLVRTRVQPLQPITRRQMAVIAMFGRVGLQADRHVPRCLDAHGARTRRPRQRIAFLATVHPIERVIAWYRGATLEVLTGHHVFTPVAARRRRATCHSLA